MIRDYSLYTYKINVLMHIINLTLNKNLCVKHIKDSTVSQVRKIYHEQISIYHMCVSVPLVLMVQCICVFHFASPANFIFNSAMQMIQYIIIRLYQKERERQKQTREIDRNKATSERRGEKKGYNHELCLCIEQDHITKMRTNTKKTTQNNRVPKSCWLRLRLRLV